MVPRLLGVDDAASRLPWQPGWDEHGEEVASQEEMVAAAGDTVV